MPPLSDATRPVAAPLTIAQRICLQELLDEEWRAQVRQLTGLATAYHSAESAGDESAAERLSAALAVVRRRLVDTEAALARLESKTYGACDGCDRRMPFEQLEMNPLARFCTGCQPLAWLAPRAYGQGMGSKDKAGREAKKPKKDKKAKAAPATSVIPPSTHASHGAQSTDKPAH